MSAYKPICVLYDIHKAAPLFQGSEGQDRIDYLVLEYLQEETLAKRLLKGPLPLAQFLHYSIEIADALDKAHRKELPPPKQTVSPCR